MNTETAVSFQSYTLRPIRPLDAVLMERNPQKICAEIRRLIQVSENIFGMCWDDAIRSDGLCTLTRIKHLMVDPSEERVTCVIFDAFLELGERLDLAGYFEEAIDCKMLSLVFRHAIHGSATSLDFSDVLSLNPPSDTECQDLESDTVMCGASTNDTEFSPCMAEGAQNESNNTEFAPPRSSNLSIAA
jgi:hypothetical protein